MKSQYELRKFRGSKDKDLPRALSIYANNIEPILRTDTKEIIYWLDKYPSLFNDKFLVFGFYLNDKIVGFAQLAYFIEEKIVFVDYVVIAKEFRRNNTFYEFLEEIREFFVENDIIYDYIIAEVGGFNNEMEPANTTKSLIRLLKMLGFGVLKTTYFHPALGKMNHERGLQSVLMLFTPGEIKAIKKETFLTFLSTIYFKHYCRWYQAFLSTSEIADYETQLHLLYDKTKHLLRKADQIEINSYANTYTVGAGKGSDKRETMASGILKMFVLMIVFVSFFIFIHTFIKTRTNVDTSSKFYTIVYFSFITLTILIEVRIKLVFRLLTFISQFLLFFDKKNNV